MEWSLDKCRVLYAESIEYLKNSLGITQIDLDNTCHEIYLLPYQVVIIKYINENLIRLGTDDLKTKVNCIFDLFWNGTNEMLGCYCVKDNSEETPELVLPLVDEDCPNTCCMIKRFAEKIGCDTESEFFNCGYFVYSWTNLLTALCIRLKFQYAYLFAQEYDGECCKCGARGETAKDQESWVSNVYPEDELYDRTNYTRANSAWQVSKDRYCDCYRHSTESSEADSGE